MYGDGPCQPQRELLEGAQQLFVYLLLLLVERVSHVLPYLLADIVLVTVFVAYVDDAFLGVYPRHDTDGAVDPPFLLVITHEDNLCAGFQLQLHRGGH